MENTIKVLQHKESKLSACRQSFKEHEVGGWVGGVADGVGGWVVLGHACKLVG